MNKNDYFELMNLIEAYGDACEQFGDFQGQENILNCKKAKEKIQEFLNKMLDK